MVGREVQHHRDPRTERVDLLQLKAARFDDVQRLGRRLVDLRAERRPMLPPTVTWNPAACSIRPVSAVVVDLPLVPVIAITRPCSHRDASSISPTIGMPRARAACTAGCSGGTPGLSTTRSADVNVSRRVPAELQRDAERAQRLGLGHLGPRRRTASRRAPRRASSAAAAMPLARRADDRHALASTLNPMPPLPITSRLITAASTSSG